MTAVAELQIQVGAGIQLLEVEPSAQTIANTVEDQGNIGSPFDLELVKVVVEGQAEFLDEARKATEGLLAMTGQVDSRCITAQRLFEGIESDDPLMIGAIQYLAVANNNSEQKHNRVGAALWLLKEAEAARKRYEDALGNYAVMMSGIQSEAGDNAQSVDAAKTSAKTYVEGL
jgi:hypothetical protein